MAAFFAVKELCIELDRLSHGGRRCDVQFLHLHRDKIRAEGFAVIFDVLKPIVFIAGIGNRAVDKVIAVQVIMQKQLLYGKIICAGQLDDLNTF